MSTFKELTAILTFQKQNIHMLHWNTRSCHFIEDHRFLQEIYTEIEKDIDDVGEIALQYVKSAEEGPMSLSEIVNFLSEDATEHIEFSGKRYYNHNETISAAITSVSDIIQTMMVVRGMDGINPAHVSDVDALLAKYLKYKMLLEFSIDTEAE